MVRYKVDAAVKKTAPPPVKVLNAWLLVSVQSVRVTVAALDAIAPPAPAVVDWALFPVKVVDVAVNAAPAATETPPPTPPPAAHALVLTVHAVMVTAVEAPNA